MSYIRFVAGEAVKVGRLTLPGVVESIQVNGDLQIDEQDLENTNLKALAVQGFTTQKVQLQVRILGDSQAHLNQQVRQIQQAFQIDRVKEAGAKLVPVRMVNPHLDARRIKVMVFDSFTTVEGNEGEFDILATLSFHEFASDVARLMDRVSKEKARRKKKAENDAAGIGAGGGGPNGTPSPPGGGKGTVGPDGKPVSSIASQFLRGTVNGGAGAHVVDAIAGKVLGGP